MTQHNRTSSTMGAKGRTQRRVGIGSVGATLGLTLLFLASSAAIAATHAGVTLKAPYGATSYSVSSSGFGGCGSQRTVHPASFNPGNGLVQTAQAAHTEVCPSSLGGPATLSWSSFANALYVYWPISIPSGAHDVQINVTNAENATVQIADSGRCTTSSTSYFWGNATYGSCVAYAETNWGASWWIYDATNGTLIDGGPFTTIPSPVYVEDAKVVDFGCYNAAYGGACFAYNSTYSTPTRSVNVPNSPETANYDNNGTFNGTHTYYFVWEGATDMNTEVVGWTSASAHANLNIASHGNGVRFNWIKVL